MLHLNAAQNMHDMEIKSKYLRILSNLHAQLLNLNIHSTLQFIRLIYTVGTSIKFMTSFELFSVTIAMGDILADHG